MAQPTFIGSGVTLQLGDTRLMLLAKLVGAAQNANAGADAINNPTPRDTQRILWLKLLRAIQDWGGSAAVNAPALNDTIHRLMVKVLRALQNYNGASVAANDPAFNDTNNLLWRKILKSINTL